MKGLDVIIVLKKGGVLGFILFLLCIAGFNARSQAQDRIAADALFNGNLALTNGGEYEIAEKGWEDFLKKFPENSQVAHAEHYLAICKHQTGQYVEAERIFEAELTEGRFPVRDEAIYFLAMTLMKHAETFPQVRCGCLSGRIETVADRCYALSPEATALLQKALTQFHQLREQFPDSRFRTDAMFYEALTYIQLGKYENALGNLKLVVATQGFPNLNYALYMLSTAYVNLPKPNDKNALITLQTLLENAPETYWKLRALRLMGDLYFRMERYELALETFEALNDEEFAEFMKVEKGQPGVLDMAVLRYRHAETLKKLRRFDEASEMFGQVAENFPESTLALHALYQKSLSMKQYNNHIPEGGKAFDLAECVALWEQVLERTDSTKDRVLRRSATHQLALYYLQTDAPKRALETVDRIPQKQQTPTLLRDRADALAHCGLYDEAIALYRQLFQRKQTPKTMIEGADAMLSAVRLSAKRENFPAVLQLTSEVILWDAFSRLPEEMQSMFLEENAGALFQTDDYVAARQGWERLLQRFPKALNRDRWTVAVAHCYQKGGASRDGYKFCLKQVKNVKEAVSAVEMRHLLGICYRDYAQTKKSEKLTQKYLDKAKNSLIRAKNEARKLKKPTTYTGLDMIYYDLSMVYFLQKDYTACIKNIGFGLKNCADSPIAEQLLFLRGRCEVELESLEEAASTFEAFSEKYPESAQCAEAGLLAAQCYLKLGEMQKATDISRTMSERFPESNLQERSANVRAVAAMEVEDYDVALEAWNVILKSDTQEYKTLRPEAMYQIAYCQFQKKDYSVAEAGFLELLDKYPDWESLERLYNQLTRTYLEQNKAQSAQDTLAAMRGKFPQSVFLDALHFQLGMLWYTDGKMEEAQESFQTVLMSKNKENAPDYLYNNATTKLAWTLFNQEKYQEVVDFVKSQNLMTSVDKPVSDNTVQEEAVQEEAVQGETTPEENEIRTSQAELRFLEGMAYYHLKNTSEALKLLQDVRKDATLPHVFSENALEIIVQIYEDAEKWENVVDTGMEFLGIYPNSENRVRMEFKRAVALFRLEKMEEALSACERILNTNDPIFTPQALFLQGEVLFAQKQYETAIQTFYQVIYGVNEPELQSNALFETAQCFEMLGKKDKALKHYQELLQQYPKSAKVKLAKRKMKKL